MGIRQSKSKAGGERKLGATQKDERENVRPRGDLTHPLSRAKSPNHQRNGECPFFLISLVTIGGKRSEDIYSAI